MRDEGIYKEYCKLNNISWQDASLYKVDIKNTFQYQCFALKKEIYGIFEEFIGELKHCADYSKRKGIIK